jgi:hypothetical protein
MHVRDCQSQCLRGPRHLHSVVILLQMYFVLPSLSSPSSCIIQGFFEIASCIFTDPNPLLVSFCFPFPFESVMLPIGYM